MNDMTDKSFDASAKTVLPAPDTTVDVAKAGSQMMAVMPKYEGSPFMDKRIRQALTLAIDRQKIIDIVYGGRYAWIPNDTHMADFNEDFLARPAVRDVAKAKQLLVEAGHPNGITLPTLYYSTYYPEIDRVFQVMSESVKDAGITMPIELKQKSGYRKWRVEDKKKTRKHRFAMGPVGARNPAERAHESAPVVEDSLVDPSVLAHQRGDLSRGIRGERSSRRVERRGGHDV